MKCILVSRYLHRSVMRSYVNGTSFTCTLMHIIICLYQNQYCTRSVLLNKHWLFLLGLLMNHNLSIIIAVIVVIAFTRPRRDNAFYLASAENPSPQHRWSCNPLVTELDFFLVFLYCFFFGFIFYMFWCLNLLNVCIFFSFIFIICNKGCSSFFFFYYFCCLFSVIFIVTSYNETATTIPINKIRNYVVLLLRFQYVHNMYPVQQINFAKNNEIVEKQFVLSINFLLFPPKHTYLMLNSLLFLAQAWYSFLLNFFAMLN